jgi:beta-xylosidase
MRQNKADTLVTSSGYFMRGEEKIAHGPHLTNWVQGWNLFDQEVISLGPARIPGMRQ